MAQTVIKTLVEVNYSQKLQARIQKTGGCLCVGLDPRPEMLAPGQSLSSFCQQVIEETSAQAAAFKPNLAYFEALGSRGLAQMEQVLESIPSEIPIILDAKRGDIGATQEYYAKALFETWGADALTLSPWMGFDSLEPMLNYPQKGVYILAVTSNPGAADIELQKLANGQAIWQLAAEFAKRASHFPACAGLVLGLTHAAAVLDQVPDVPLLIPGLGAQGGDLQALQGKARFAPLLVNASRAILQPTSTQTRSQIAQHYVQQTQFLATSNS